MALRLVQLGLGGWGRNWVEEVTRAVPGVEPVAWVEPDPAGRERAMAELELPAGGCSARCRRRSPRCRPMRPWPWCRSRRTPRSSARRSRRGCTCWSRSRSPGAGRGGRLVELARERRRVLMVNQNYRWFPAPRARPRGCCARARSASRSPATSTSTSCSAPTTATSSSTSRCSATWRSTISTRLRFVLDDEPVEVSCHELERARHAVQGPPGGGRDDPLRQGHGRQLPRQLDLARARPRPTAATGASTARAARSSSPSAAPSRSARSSTA